MFVCDLVFLGSYILVFVFSLGCRWGLVASEAVVILLHTAARSMKEVAHEFRIRSCWPQHGWRSLYSWRSIPRSYQLSTPPKYWKLSNGYVEKAVLACEAAKSCWAFLWLQGTGMHENHTSSASCPKPP